MAKTIKIGDEYYSEGVRVPAPKKPVVKKSTPKKTPKKTDKISAAWAGAKARQKKWGSK